MSEMNRINEENLENVVGGAIRIVNTGSSRNAALSEGPGTEFDQIDSLKNGTKVNTTGRRIFNEDDGRYFSEVRVNGIKGWIASSIIGEGR